MHERMAMDDYELLDLLKRQLGEAVNTQKTLILYGTESGNAQALASQLAYELKRRGVRAQLENMADCDVDDLKDNE